MVRKSIPNLQPLTEKKLFFLILLGSFILKGILIFSVQVPSPDGIVYINAAREFSQGNFYQGIQIFPMPFYPLLVSLLHSIIPDWLRAEQTISWLSLVLATIPLYQITKTLFDRESALWSITAYSLAPHFNTYASQDSDNCFYCYHPCSFPIAKEFSASTFPIISKVKAVAPTFFRISA